MWFGDEKRNSRNDVSEADCLPSIRQAKRLPYKFFNWFKSAIRRVRDLAVNDVQRPFFDIERGFSDGFA
jgi:hypothetical protein